MTLIELLICLFLISTVMVGLISALFTTIRSSGDNVDRQRIEAALMSYGSSVKQMPYQRCEALPTLTPTSYTTRSRTTSGTYVPWNAPSNMTARITAIDFWHTAPDPVNNLPANRWDSICPSNGDRGTQRLTIEVTYRGETGTAEVVKRNPAS